MDILDEFSKEDQIMEEEEVQELMSLINKLMTGRMSRNDYFQKLSDFWSKQGLTEYAEEALLHVKD
jgi:hypothetical protein